MMRVIINLIKTSILLAVTCGAVWLTTQVAFVHYQGQVAALDLMGLETAPLAQDPLVGWIFEAAAGDANYTNWLAFSLTGLIVLFAWMVSHFGLSLVGLISEASDFIRGGQRTQFRRTVAYHAVAFALSALALGVLLAADLSLYQYRSLAGALNISDPVEAAHRIPAIGALATSDFAISSIAFLSGIGGAMYVVLGIAPAIASEMLIGCFYNSLVQLEQSCQDIWRSLTGAAGEQVAQTLYGYDADGEPVFDPDLPIAYDTDQNPVHPASDETQEVAPVTTPADAPVATPAPAEAAADDGLLDVIGGAKGQRVRLSDALARPELYHYCREQSAVFTRPYWQALHAESESQDTAEPEYQPHPESRKEAA